MSDDEKKETSDLLGLGAIAKAIPPESWNKLTELACATMQRLLAPITEATGGLGRLIEARFDRMVDAQKVLAAEAMRAAVNKTHSLPENVGASAKAAVIISSLEAASLETNSPMRELWANLIAQELTGGAVHPIFPTILSQLSPLDAQVLASIANGEPTNTWGNLAVKALLASLAAMAIVGATGLSSMTKAPPRSFTHEHLAGLRLIREGSGRWHLTETGKEFIRSVSEPVTNQ